MKIFTVQYLIAVQYIDMVTLTKKMHQKFVYIHFFTFLRIGKTFRGVWGKAPYPHPLDTGDLMFLYVISWN
jgi:hypothetical protein